MTKFKNKKKKNIQIKSQKISSGNEISFGFKYMTNNKKHSFDYFGKDMRSAHKAYESFLNKMKSLCEMNISVAHFNGKIQGCELMPYSQLSESMKNICNSIEIISRESSLYVFRFCQNDYRLLCKSDLDHSNLLHIIGFDFNYNAYDHG